MKQAQEPVLFEQEDRYLQLSVSCKSSGGIDPETGVYAPVFRSIAVKNHPVFSRWSVKPVIAMGIAGIGNQFPDFIIMKPGKWVGYVTLCAQRHDAGPGLRDGLRDVP